MRSHSPGAIASTLNSANRRFLFRCRRARSALDIAFSPIGGLPIVASPIFLDLHLIAFRRISRFIFETKLWFRDDLLKRNSSIVTIVASETCNRYFGIDSGASAYLLLPVRHQSRQWIEQILKAANGKHMFPKAVFDAQTPPMDMTYPAIRKLMREMMRGGLRRDKDGYYLIRLPLTDNERNQIEVAHREELYEEIKILMERHRRQRRTVAKDFIHALEKHLSEVRAKSK
jgi:hypothetical protein